MRLYVGNLSRKVTEEDLRQPFEAFGYVASVTLIRDRFTGEVRGFGFVEMPARTEAESAMTSLNGKELKGRTLKVGKAHPHSERRRSRRRPGAEWRF